jgi:uncharacterized membrane protein YfcA
MLTWLFEIIPPETEPWVYITSVGAAVLLIGVSKAGFGGGVGIAAVPLMAIALPTHRAVGVLLPVLIVADVFSVTHHRGQQSRPHLRWMLAGAVAGIALGTLFLVYLQYQQGQATFEQVLNVMIGGLCLLFVGLQVYRLMGGAVPHLPRTPTTGRIAGGLAGFVSTLMHGAGPVMTVYLLEQRLTKRHLVGTAVLFIFIVNLLKLPTYFGLMLINPGSLLQSLWCLPLVPIGTLAGMWMHKRINERLFTIVMYVGTAAAAGHMLYKAMA